MVGAKIEDDSMVFAQSKWPKTASWTYRYGSFSSRKDKWTSGRPSNFLYSHCENSQAFILLPGSHTLWQRRLQSFQALLSSSPQPTTGEGNELLKKLTLLANKIPAIHTSQPNAIAARSPDTSLGSVPRGRDIHWPIPHRAEQQLQSRKNLSRQHRMPVARNSSGRSRLQVSRTTEELPERNV